jgi:hypothetical protein
MILLIGTLKLSLFFDEIAPDLTDLNIQIESKTVVALLFKTNRFLFVVKNAAFGNPGGGPVSLEVPWREGTRIRSAHRNDLIKLLMPLESLPKIEVINSKVLLYKKEDSINKWPSHLILNIELYITPKSSDVIVIPFHRCKGWIKISGSLPEIELQSISLKAVSGSMGT